MLYPKRHHESQPAEKFYGKLTIIVNKRISVLFSSWQGHEDHSDKSESLENSANEDGSVSGSVVESLLLGIQLKTFLN